MHLRLGPVVPIEREAETARAGRRRRPEAVDIAGVHAPDHAIAVLPPRSQAGQPHLVDPGRLRPRRASVQRTTFAKLDVPQGGGGAVPHDHRAVSHHALEIGTDLQIRGIGGARPRREQADEQAEQRDPTPPLSRAHIVLRKQPPDAVVRQGVFCKAFTCVRSVAEPDVPAASKYSNSQHCLPGDPGLSPRLIGPGGG